MAVTPDFVGQIYKDTATGNLWRANSTTAGDWTLELQNMQVAWSPTNLKFGEMVGFFTYNILPGITDVSFQGATSIVGFDIEDTDDLVTVSFPNLISIDPTDSQDGYLLIAGCNSLTTVSLPSLSYVSGELRITNCDNLASLDLHSLVYCGDWLHLAVSSVTSLSLSQLSLCSDISVVSNSLLTTISIPSLTSLDVDIDLSDNALTASSIEHVLSVLVGLGATYSGHFITLTGGTNAGLASLSAQGQADYATLVARPNTVNINA